MKLKLIVASAWSLGQQSIHCSALREQFSSVLTNKALVMAGFWAPQLISVPMRRRNQNQRPP